MTNFLEERVSIFGHGWQDVWPLRDFLFKETIRNEKRQSIVERYRQKYQAEDTAGKWLQRCYVPSLTKEIPCCTISGIFRKQGRRYEIKTRSGLICISINEADNRGLSLEAMRVEIIRYFPQILYISLSADGEGLMAIIRLQYPDRYYSQVRRLAADFKAVGIKIDDRLNYEKRFCPLTYDPDPYINERAIPYDKTDDRSGI